MNLVEVLKREETYALCTLACPAQEVKRRRGALKVEKSVVKSSSEWRGCRCFVNLAYSQLSCITILPARLSALPFANKMFTRAMHSHLPLQKRVQTCSNLFLASLLLLCACCLRYKASSRVFLLFSNVALTLKLLSGLLGSVRLCIL